MMVNYLTKDDLILLLSVLNEVQNGIDLFEFETRIGFSKTEVKNIEEKIRAIVDSDAL